MKVTKFSIFLFVASFYISSCQNNDPTSKSGIGAKGNIDSTEDDISVSLIYPEKDSIFNYSVAHMSSDGYSLEISTTLIYDSVFLNDYYYSRGNEVVLNQELVFRHNDSILARKPLEYPLFRSGSKNYPEYVATNFLFKKINNNTLYIIYAFGLSNGSKEVSSYYTNKGEFIGETTCGRRQCDTIGSLLSLESKYKVFDTTKLNQIYIFPPQSAGKKDL